MAPRPPESQNPDLLEAVRDRIAERSANAGRWFDATNIEHLTGFRKSWTRT